MNIQTINITGRRWFDSNGNTYFSATGSINGEMVAEIEYEYGYGDQYLQSITDQLIEKGLIPSNDDRKAATWFLRELCEAPGGFTYSVTDVARKKDL